MSTATAKKATPRVATEYRVVVREFDGNGVTRVSGEVVNVAEAGWRNAGTLEGLRYLRAFSGTEPVAAKDGRLFQDEATRDRYEQSRRKSRPKAAAAAAEE